jgi:hypothetical protein
VWTFNHMRGPCWQQIGIPAKGSNHHHQQDSKKRECIIAGNSATNTKSFRPLSSDFHSMSIVHLMSLCCSSCRKRWAKVHQSPFRQVPQCKSAAVAAAAGQELFQTGSRSLNHLKNGQLQ